MNQLLNRLHKDLSAATDSMERAEILARISCNLARLGRFDEAKQVVLDLRLSFGDGSSGKVTVWIMLAEALIYHFSEYNPLALDRIKRAQILGEAMGYLAFVAIVAAWRAYIEFETSKFDSMVSSLKLALANSNKNDHDALARISIVLCNSFTISGNLHQAQTWFMRGRDHALKNGDQASIDAMLFNRAVFTFSWLRAENCCGRFHDENLSLNRLQVESAKNFQEMMRVGAFQYHIQFCEARLLILEKKYDIAANRLAALKNRLPFPEVNFDPNFVSLEICFCRFMAGDGNKSRELFVDIDDINFAGLDIDERLAAAWMHSKLCDADERFGDIGKCQKRLENLRACYQAFRQKLSLSLSIEEFN